MSKLTRQQQHRSDDPALHSWDIDGGNALTDEGAEVVRIQMATVYAPKAQPVTQITREVAEQALTAIKGQWPYDVADAGEKYGPKLIENWDWTESLTRWAIVWEMGPDEWAYKAGDGGEVYTELGTVNIPAATDFPQGVFAEPVTSWAVGLYLI